MGGDIKEKKIKKKVEEHTLCQPPLAAVAWGWLRLVQLRPQHSADTQDGGSPGQYTLLEMGAPSSRPFTSTCQKIGLICLLS